ncbi:MAG: hypothetical protein AABY07_00105 [Nanoarchaeota archaeon]
MCPTYNLSLEIDKINAVNRLNKFIKEKTVIELRKRVPRSLSQNNYLYLILRYFGSQTGYTLEEAKQIYKIQSENIFFYEKNGILFTRSTSDLTSTEMTNSIANFREYSNFDAGIYLPEPFEKEYLEEIS